MGSNDPVMNESTNQMIYEMNHTSPNISGFVAQLVETSFPGSLCCWRPWEQGHGFKHIEVLSLSGFFTQLLKLR